MADSWTERLWADVAGVFAAILAQPFITGLTDGSLDERRFAYYLAQDAHYLRDFARALAAVGAKAPSHRETAVFAGHAAQTATVEVVLHESLLPELGFDPATLAQIPMSPTTTAYTSYLVNVALSGSYPDGVAAVLPCFWIYQRVGDALLERGSPDPRFQRWIDTYGGEAFAESVAGVLAITDELGETLTEPARQRAAGHFRTAARYEWMFWDAAWRQEAWPI
ncbi:MAG TPA: thiaminase II [Jatrophihabitans sp.]|nr:thiaminase II [Jatrophihabitans sp.]